MVSRQAALIYFHASRLAFVKAETVTICPNLAIAVEDCRYDRTPRFGGRFLVLLLLSVVFLVSVSSAEADDG